MKDNLKRKTVAGFFWKTAERVGTQGVSFIVSIVLARMLTPEDYGIIALISIFITISNVFILSGLGTALIQKKDADETDYSSVFYCSVFIAILAYSVLFMTAPIISHFYQEPILVAVIRVLGIGLLFSGVNTVQNAYVSKTMQFKRFFYSTLSGTLVSAVIGIVLAIKGAGVWALVFQQLVNSFVNTVVLWYTVKWRPKLLFSKTRLKKLYGFGWKLLVSSLLEQLYNNIYGLVIGKVYNSYWLGVYNKGLNFPNLIVSNLIGPIQSVLLPALSIQQDDKKAMRQMLRKMIQVSAYVFFPLLMGMAATGDAIVGILLTDKWNACIPFLRISCITLSFIPIQMVNVQAIGALGKGATYLKIEVIKETIGYILLVVSLPFGIYAMVIGKAIQSLIAFFVQIYYNRKLFDYEVSKQLQDVFPAFFLSVVMGFIVEKISLLSFPDVFTLCIQIVLGIIIYVLGSYVLRIEAMVDVLNVCKKYQIKKKNRS